MDVIIVTRSGVMDTPILIADTTTAMAQFDAIAEQLLEEDYEELSAVDYGCRLEEANRMLEGTGNEINWFTEIEVNEYVNEVIDECPKCGEDFDATDNPDRCPHCLTSL